MIDIHAHILPGVDDGAKTLEDSLAMARQAATDGTTDLICTSHSAEWFEIGRLSEMETHIRRVQDALDAAGVRLKLWPGMEIFLSPYTPRHLGEGRAWPLAGSHYVLVEVPYDPWPAYADQTLFQLQIDGYAPILAHPERYVAIQRDPNMMYRLAERGVLAQVTAGALAGHYGDPIRRCAVTLAEHGMVQFLASDAHTAATRHRSPILSEGYNVLAGLVGAEAAAAMATTLPGKVLAHEPISPDARPVEPPRSFFARLFGGRAASS